jgi:coenzyme F420 hydrogenase subunit beta
MKNSVSYGIDWVVSKGLCHGCGTCYAVCPVEAISITRNHSLGVYQPVVDEHICSQCGVCVRVCPGHAVDFVALYDQVFARQPEDAWLGVHINRYLARAMDEEVRFNSSSGGLATTLLIFALEQGIIDKAIVTRMNGERPLEPEVIAADTKEGIISAMGSKYCPVPVNMALRSVLKDDAKFAIVGLPCHLHGLRKLEAIKPELRKKIILRIGLMCSNTATFLGTEYFLRKKGIDPEDVRTLSYRGRGWLGSIVVSLKDGPERLFPRVSSDRRDQVIHSAAFHHAFASPRCLVCCDHMAEFSDISLGDPRLPELVRREKVGKSLVVTRNSVGESLFRAALSAKAIALDEVLTRDRLYCGQNIEFKRHNATIRARKLFRRPVPVYQTTKPLVVPLSGYCRVIYFLPSYFSHRRSLWPMLSPLTCLNRRIARMVVILKAVFQKLGFAKGHKGDS